jgi:hypothetical protein
MNFRLISGFSQYLFGRSKASAVTEFLIFTLPFFIILLLITTSVYQNSMANSEAKNLARQSLRAFISSPNNEIAEVRANQVIEIYRNSLSAQNATARNFSIKFSCTNNPCLSPGGSVSAFLEVSITGNPSRKVFGTATEYVDLWR